MKAPCAVCAEPAYWEFTRTQGGNRVTRWIHRRTLTACQRHLYEVAEQVRTQWGPNPGGDDQ